MGLWLFQDHSVKWTNRMVLSLYQGQQFSQRSLYCWTVTLAEATQRSRIVRKHMSRQETLDKVTHLKKKPRGRPSRWRRSKTWRWPCSAQIHQKYIYMWNNSYRTPTERWQKTSDFPKGKKLPTYLGRGKEKRKNRDKRIGTGPAPLGGSCEGRKVSTH